jgi:hypothetical protein
MALLQKVHLCNAISRIDRYCLLKRGRRNIKRRHNHESHACSHVGWGAGQRSDHRGNRATAYSGVPATAIRLWRGLSRPFQSRQSRPELLWAKRPSWRPLLVERFSEIDHMRRTSASSFRGAAAKRRRTRNPVTTDTDYWIPVSRPSAFGRWSRPGMTMQVIRTLKSFN